MTSYVSTASSTGESLKTRTAMGQFGRQWLGRHLASRGLRAGTVLVAAGSSALLGGCINVTAPDKPIVIELNVNIRQEVVYQMAADAAKSIDNNKGIF